ncbi:hypothetical protein [Massilia sp. CCM 8734]|uniref:hypothetical protein n=1 Tax=Massilia sp. CCM 8734 TaxID=2609283 RepID=UPI001422DDFD|nr:hypothetical protein [Massilia sp. CCM 8734]NHZ95230.1 hypothetical protein [Massilia sp. CCM 8734]
MTMGIDEYIDTFQGFYIIGCAVRNRMIFGFVVDSYYTDVQVEIEEENEYDPAYRPKRMLTHYRDDEPGDQWGVTDYEGWSFIVIGSALLPKSQFLAAELYGKVHAVGSDEDSYDNSLIERKAGNPNGGGIRKLKQIGGYAYICGGARSVGKRLADGEWLSHTDAFPSHPEIGRDGFDDIDGFSETDIYAGGGMGDVWRYDGKRWMQVDFPSNSWIQAICCGADGNVYISCYEGLIFAGRENQWTKIHDGGISLGFRDMVWYEDRVWCTNDYGFWTIHNGALTQVTDLPSKILVCAGRLSTGDGVLLAAGLRGAAFLENGKWNSIFLRSEMEKIVKNMS